MEYENWTFVENMDNNGYRWGPTIDNFGKEPYFNTFGNLYPVRKCDDLEADLWTLGSLSETDNPKYIQLQYDHIYYYIGWFNQNNNLNLKYWHGQGPDIPTDANLHFPLVMLRNKRLYNGKDINSPFVWCNRYPPNQVPQAWNDIVAYKPIDNKDS